MADMNTFFHEATLRICGSLEIETVAKDCLEYLKDFMPLDGILIIHYDRLSMSLMVLAAASNVPLNLNRNAHTVIKFSPEAHQELNRAKKNIRIYNNAEGILSKNMWENLGFMDKSSILLSVEFKGKRIGGVIFFCRGQNRYSEGHAELVRQLYKPFSIALANSLQYQEIVDIKRLLEDDNRSLRQELHAKPHAEIIGAYGGLKDVMAAVEQVAPLTSHVLLLGETGVGKEVISNAIHYSSPRRSGPFVKVNCGAIPAGLINTELYGHEKGAFTGALSRKYGRFELANGGTIFLDEIGDLPAHAQATLLRVLQEKEIDRVGGTRPVKVDVRVITATHRNLEELVSKGDFREDLFFRLNVFPIVIPPLRERRSDIPDLVHHFIVKKSQEMNIGRVPIIIPGTMERLMSYDWPGNVRELENAVERALIRSRALDPKRPLEFEDFVPGPQAPVDPSGTLPMRESGDIRPLDDVMRDHIQATLKRVGGRVQGPGDASSLLKIKPNTLRHRMRKLGIPFGKKA